MLDNFGDDLTLIAATDTWALSVAFAAAARNDDPAAAAEPKTLSVSMKINERKALVTYLLLLPLQLLLEVLPNWHQPAIGHVSKFDVRWLRDAVCVCMPSEGKTYLC